MTRPLTVILALLTACWLATGAAKAARVALVIGNGDYRQTRPLPNAVNDARAMADRLRGLGFEVFEGTDLTRGAMLALVQDFARALRPEDMALLYYAGHGVQLGAENYLIPVDTGLGAAAELAGTSVRLQSVLRSMELRADTRLVILDACRDSPFVEAVATRSGGPASRGLARIEAGVGSFIAFSTQPGNVASDGAGRNSPFSEALLRHIGAPGADIHEIMRRVRADVSQATGGTQIPWENSSLVRQVYFVPPGGAAPDAATGSAAAVASEPGPDAAPREKPAAATPAAPQPAPAQAPASAMAALPQSALPQAAVPPAAAPSVQFHYVDGLDPAGDNFLALRSAPAGAGHRLAKMGPGTLLEVLGRQGDWLQVRLTDGSAGWAHGNWIHCCRPVHAAPPQPVERTAASCDQLWYRRNAIWHRNGYCFRTARGQAAFGNAGCSRDQAAAQAAMSPADRAEVDRLVAEERAQGCR